MSAGTSASSAAAVVVMIGTDQEGLPHVRDIEQPGLVARVQVLLEDAERILHRHLVAGERHHLGAERHVQLVERRALQGCVGSRVRRSYRLKSHVACIPRRSARVEAPSVTGPERFRRELVPPYPFGEPAR